jgi:hypothetical protein
VPCLTACCFVCLPACLPTLRCGHGFVHHRNDLDADDWGTAHLDRTSNFSFLQFVVTAGAFHVLQDRCYSSC